MSVFSNLINRALEVLQVKNEDIHIGSQRLLLFHSSRIVLNQGMKILGLQPLHQMWLFCISAVSAISDLGYMINYSHCYSNSSIDIFMRAGHFTTKPALLFLCLPLTTLLYLCPLCHSSVLSSLHTPSAVFFTGHLTSSLLVAVSMEFSRCIFLKMKMWNIMRYSSSNKIVVTYVLFHSALEQRLKSSFL